MKLFAPKRIYIILAIFVMANVFVTIKVITDRRFFNSSDFLAYSVGARIIMDGRGRDLYNIETQTSYWNSMFETTKSQLLPYIAPPATALLFAPFSFVPTQIRASVAMLVSIALVLVGSWIVGDAIGKVKLALLSIFSSWFVWVCIWQIQPTAVLFLLTALVYRTLSKKQYVLLGLLCAFYILKPQYLIIAPLIFLLTGKNRDFLKAFTTMFLILLLLNVALVGPKNLFYDYPVFLISIDNPTYGNRWYEMYSIQQGLYRFSRHLVDSKIPSLIAGAVFYLWALVKVNELVSMKKSLTHTFPIIIIITLLSAYHVLPQDMSIMAISVFLIQPKTRLLLIYQITILVADIGMLANYYSLGYLAFAINLLLTYPKQKHVEVSTDKY